MKKNNKYLLHLIRTTIFLNQQQKKNYDGKVPEFWVPLLLQSITTIHNSNKEIVSTARKGRDTIDCR